MDTLFRLVSLQSDQSYNSSRTSTSSKSSTQNHHHHPEECINLFMDEDDFSSSSSKHFNPYHLRPSPTHPPNSTPITPPFEPSQFNFSSTPNLQFPSSNKWASSLLLECGRAMAEKNSNRVQQLMWMLNELSSPYGDTDQKLAAYFLQAIFCQITNSGERTHHTLTAASEKNCSFESTRKTILKFQEVSPWTTFGHVASNGAILEAFEGENKLHIIDISNTFCTQWPTLLESLATRNDDTPHLRLTTVVGDAAGVQKVMKEIGNRMEKFARLMGVPFKFNVVRHAGDLSELNFNMLEINEDEALAINCVGTLHSVAPVASRRDGVMSAFRHLRPKIVTVVEEEADFCYENNSGDDDFVRGFEECLRWFGVYLEALEESFPRASNERFMLERVAGRAVVDLIACPQAESRERREVAGRWSGRLLRAGFAPAVFSDDVADDVRALLRRYKEGWSMNSGGDAAGIFLAWKEQPVVWASAWKAGI
ncbi:protein SHORT-ROOT-like [Tasmannia lanceolata]|uniref:protein SHORT-ROOT-like n=1 Tax=Tasmannia lanceolata TaxID=3420 RepID=UPI0040646242